MASPDSPSMLSLRSRRRSLRVAARPLASAMPPSTATRVDTMRKSSMLGARERMLARASAPSSPLMLLKKWNLRRAWTLGMSSSSARAAWTEMPSLRNATSSIWGWLVMASPTARTPFSPSALSLKSKLLSLHTDRALAMMRSVSSASSSGRPAMMSEKSASLSVPLMLCRARVVTSAASRPKLLVLSRILVKAAPSLRSGARTSSARSPWRNSLLLPKRSNSVVDDAPAAAESVAPAPRTASRTSPPQARA
mmetsp:Transcript_57628/g.182536  ORF Transcript_57628/g.182536 Transcript_57628/m.182536 type:complete len:252 (-) Transcript_57628:336-1091(-)